MEYKCPKCGNNTYETDTIAATGGGFSKFFDVQNKKFTAVICTNCKYVDLYKVKSSMLGNIFDLFTG